MKTLKELKAEAVQTFQNESITALIDACTTKKQFQKLISEIEKEIESTLESGVSMRLIELFGKTEKVLYSDTLTDDEYFSEFKSDLNTLIKYVKKVVFHTTTAKNSELKMLITLDGKTFVWTFKDGKFMGGLSLAAESKAINLGLGFRPTQLERVKKQMISSIGIDADGLNQTLIAEKAINGSNKAIEQFLPEFKLLN